jgi:hypothetical protein
LTKFKKYDIIYIENKKESWYYMFYYTEENIVFYDKANARNYFYEFGMHELYDDSFTFNEFLDKRYELSDIFRMSEDEKEDIIDEYYDYLFDIWFEEDVSSVDVYNG